jgi:hypothetical protein
MKIQRRDKQMEITIAVWVVVTQKDGSTYERLYDFAPTMDVARDIARNLRACEVNAKVRARRGKGGEWEEVG